MNLINERIIKRIASIISNSPLASAINSSVNAALECDFVHLVNGKTVWSVFKHSLDAAIRDIKNHPRGILFQRLIKYGPLNPDDPPDDPKIIKKDGKDTLTDYECGLCVEFIYSHMVNRFKGELAELLALEPCINIIQSLKQEKLLSSNVQFYWGETIQERRRIKAAKGQLSEGWSTFSKGADGLIAEQVTAYQGVKHNSLRVHGIVEVKSMVLSQRKILDQINKHIVRLGGGVKLGAREWLPDKINFAPIINITVIPSTWKLSREWDIIKTDSKSKMVLPGQSEPQTQTQIENLGDNVWKIRLAWSQEAIEQAAYEMTFWYMSQVGKQVFTKENIPKGWEYMTPEEAGYNAIKMMLYYIPLRYISKRQERLATKLYNVYCFGYPLGVDSKEMLWPEDFTA